jgi:hypothetical protein
VSTFFCAPRQVKPIRTQAECERVDILDHQLASFANGFRLACMKTRSNKRSGKKKPVSGRKPATVAEYLCSVEPARKPRPDLNFAEMLMADRSRE